MLSLQPRPPAQLTPSRAARQAALPSLNAGSGRRLTPQHAFHLLSEVVPGIFSEAGPALGAGSGETGRDTVWEKPWQRLEVPRGHAGREAGTIKWGSAGRRRRDRHRRRRKQRRRLRTTCRVPSAPSRTASPSLLASTRWWNQVACRADRRLNRRSLTGFLMNRQGEPRVLVSLRCDVGRHEPTGGMCSPIRRTITPACLLFCCKDAHGLDP